MTIRGKDTREYRVLIITPYKTTKKKTLASSEEEAISGVKSRLSQDMKHAKVVIDNQATFDEINDDTVTLKGPIVDAYGKIHGDD